MKMMLLLEMLEFQLAGRKGKACLQKCHLKSVAEFVVVLGMMELFWELVVFVAKVGLVVEVVV